MFCGCSNLETLDVSNFNLNHVIYLNWPYYDTKAIEKGLKSMFKNCISLRNLNMFPIPFPHKDRDEHYQRYILNLSNMFENCQSLTELDLQGFYVFLKAIDTETADHIVTTELYGTFMQDTFKGCTNLKTIYTDQTDTASFYYDNYETAQQLFKQYTLAFSDCDSLEGGNGTTYQNMKIKYPNPDIYNDVTRFGEVDQGEVNEGYFTYKNYN
jgi:surface protein